MDKLRKFVYLLNNVYQDHCILSQLKKRLKTDDDILLVHQMGRVASMTMVRTLQAAKPDLPLYHTHFLNPEHVQARLKKKKGTIIPRHLKVSRILFKELATELHRRHWKIVSIIRDPVARNISAFFLSIEYFLADFQQPYLRGEISLDIMLETFLKEYNHDIPLRWFDKEVKAVFGIDVYEHPFPNTDGYAIITQENVTLLIIRIEDLQQCYQEAFRNFLGLSDVNLKDRHITKKDDKHGIYKKFLKSISLPEWYLTKMYSSKFARHFYSEEEIDKFRKRWSKHPDS